jgi:putative DNA primase/helicase
MDGAISPEAALREAGVTEVALPPSPEPATDADKASPDRSHARRVFRAMARHVRAGATYDQARADLLEDPETSDWTWRRGIPNQDRELRRIWDRATARHAGGGANRPTIRITANNLAGMTDEAEKALLAADLGLYQRGEFIVRTGIVRINVSDDRTVMGQRILPLGEAALTEALDHAASWEKFDARGDEWVPADVPSKVAKIYADRIGRWRLPVLTGVINAPTLRPDGSLLATPGYDAATGLLFDPRGVTFPAIPDRPSQAQAREALAFLGTLIAKFPFVGGVTGANHSVALSAMLTASIRRSLPTAPLHGYTAPTAGSGKTKLAELPSILATGREAGVIAQGKTEEELEKRLGALLLAGEATILIDNCTDPLAGDFICQMLSQSTVRTRILGLSKTPELPSDALVLATGNNLTIAGDMTRRAMLCHLDPQCERPELRSFDSDPIEVMKANRGRYVAAALTVLRAYHVAGRPMRTAPLGSFEGWSRWVRDALLWLGKPDPVETMEQIRKADPKLEKLTAVLAQWHEVIGPGQTLKVRDIIEQATRSTTDAFGRSIFTAPDFREALLAVAGVGGAVNGQKLGHWLTAHKDRIAGGLRIIQGGESRGSSDWRLAVHQGGPTDAV